MKIIKSIPVTPDNWKEIIDLPCINSCCYYANDSFPHSTVCLGPKRKYAFAGDTIVQYDNGTWGVIPKQQDEPHTEYKPYKAVFRKQVAMDNLTEFLALPCVMAVHIDNRHSQYRAMSYVDVWNRYGENGRACIGDYIIQDDKGRWRVETLEHYIATH